MNISTITGSTFSIVVAVAALACVLLDSNTPAWMALAYGIGQLSALATVLGYMKKSDRS